MSSPISYAFCAVSTAHPRHFGQSPPAKCTCAPSLVLLSKQSPKTASSFPPGNGSIPPGGNPGRGDDSGNQPEDDNNSKSNLLLLYLTLLDRFPLATKVVTSAILTFLSDLTAQLIEMRLSSSTRSTLDYRRLAALFLVGAFLTAPMFHYLYQYLERVIPTAAGPRNLFLQLAVDQLVAGPIWLFGFFTFVGVLEGNVTPEEIAQQIDRDLVPALKLTWTVFPPVQLASFALLAPRFRVLTLNIVDLAYTACLSYLKHRPLPSS